MDDKFAGINSLIEGCWGIMFNTDNTDNKRYQEINKNLSKLKANYDTVLHETQKNTPALALNIEINCIETLAAKYAPKSKHHSQPLLSDAIDAWKTLRKMNTKIDIAYFGHLLCSTIVVCDYYVRENNDFVFTTLITLLDETQDDSCFCQLVKTMESATQNFGENYISQSEKWSNNCSKYLEFAFR